MLDEMSIWRLTKMIDVCYTNIIEPKGALLPAFNSCKFSQVIELPYYEPICELAKEIYAVMSYNGQLFPTITRDEDGLQFLYSNEEQIVIIILHPGKKMTYRLGSQVWMELPKLSILNQTLLLLCRFLDHCVEVA